MKTARRGGKRVGYIRVSTVDQNTVRQLDAIEVDKVYTDKVSGAESNRPQLQAALDYVRDGDVLVVHSMDRLARNIRNLLEIVEQLTERGVVVEFVKEHLIGTAEGMKDLDHLRRGQRVIPMEGQRVFQPPAAMLAPENFEDAAQVSQRKDDPMADSVRHRQHCVRDTGGVRLDSVNIYEHLSVRVPRDEHSAPVRC